MILPNKTVSFAIGGLSLLIACYYLAAQTFTLPFSEALQERWNGTTTMRGGRGHRDHAPRQSGPIDLTFLVVVGGVGLVRGAALTLKENRLNENEN